MTNVFNISGYFKIQAIQDGNVIWEWEKHNAIITPTIEKIAKSMMGITPYVPNANFIRLKFGNGGALPDGTPIDPIGDESDLKDIILDWTHKGIPGILYDEQGTPLVSTIQVAEIKQGNYKLTIEIDNVDGNETNQGGLREYSEIGLFFENNDMFAYRTFPRISKDTSTNLKVEWTFQFLTNKGVIQP